MRQPARVRPEWPQSINKRVVVSWFASENARATTLPIISKPERVNIGYYVLMPNPWLCVPLEDYEGHMSSASVQQLHALSALFGEVLGRSNPASLAVVGVAGGNGLEHIDSTVTRRIVGIDINPAYLDAVRHRYPILTGLELYCADLSTQTLDCAPVELVHVALVFEHAGAGQCLDNVLNLVAPDGELSVVLQLPSSAEAGVSATPFASIQNLAPHFQLIDPAQLTETLTNRGFIRTHETTHPLTSGKSFWQGTFKRATAPKR